MRAPRATSPRTGDSATLDDAPIFRTTWTFVAACAQRAEGDTNKNRYRLANTLTRNHANAKAMWTTKRLVLDTPRKVICRATITGCAAQRSFSPDATGQLSRMVSGDST
jgi:hypothetical protein